MPNLLALIALSDGGFKESGKDAVQRGDIESGEDGDCESGNENALAYNTGKRVVVVGITSGAIECEITEIMLMCWKRMSKEVQRSCRKMKIIF